MKITQDLEQFNNQKVLIVVTAKQYGDFYLANNGEINKIKSFEFDKPKYSDREGHFKKSGKSGVYGSGSVYEDKKDRIIIEINNQLEKYIKEILKEENLDNIYLFLPSRFKNNVKSTLPGSAKKLIKKTYFGNYHSIHPFDLLKIIQEEKISSSKRVIPTKESALKILKRSDR